MWTSFYFKARILLLSVSLLSRVYLITPWKKQKAREAYIYVYISSHPSSSLLFLFLHLYPSSFSFLSSSSSSSFFFLFFSYFDDDLSIGHHHGDTSKQNFEIFWKFLAACVSRIHRDEVGCRGNEFDRRTFSWKHKTPESLLLRCCYRLYLHTPNDPDRHTPRGEKREENKTQERLNLSFSLSLSSSQ